MPSRAHPFKLVDVLLPLAIALAGQAPAEPASAYTHEGYGLVWSDEFNSGTKPNSQDWIYELGFIRNQEPQWYQEQNVAIKDGMLVITGKPDKVRNPKYQPGSLDWKLNREFAPFSSGSIKTAGKRGWRYGRFESRCRIKAEDGLWPAFWLVGDEGPWPYKGEIDVMEYYQQKLHANAAWKGSEKGSAATWDAVATPIKEFFSDDPKWDSKFHVWRMDWDKDFIRLYVDGRLLNEVDLSKTVNWDGTNPFHKRFHIIFNLAIGATGGKTDKTRFPSKFEVDWVRVYQRA